MAMLVATDFFTTEVWHWFGIVLSVMCWVLYGAQWTMQGAHMTALLIGRWMLPISPWSSAWHACHAHMIDAGIRRQDGQGPCRVTQASDTLFIQSFSPITPKCLCKRSHQRGVPVCWPSPSNTGWAPKGRPPCGGCVDSDNREAA